MLSRISILSKELQRVHTTSPISVQFWPSFCEMPKLAIMGRFRSAVILRLVKRRGMSCAARPAAALLATPVAMAVAPAAPARGVRAVIRRAWMAAGTAA